jgi:Protein of unknown function (DUF3089)
VQRASSREPMADRQGRSVRPAFRATIVRRTVARSGVMVVMTMSAVAAASSLPAAASVAATHTASASSRTVWLCKPGQPNDPCTANLASTAVGANGSTKTSSAAPATASKFDCFYVYPTVSAQTTANANLAIESTETATAVDQASRFSQVCRVWAPMYRQRTVASLGRNDVDANQVAYASLLSGWEDYLAHYNHGRPVVFIGHSQGSAMLIRLLLEKIDPSAKLRAQMVSAILLGGNVTVPVGKVVGGTFTHIPTCGSARQTGCVIAYSSFGSPPPPIAVRPSWDGGEQPVRPDRFKGSPSGLRQPGQLLERQGSPPTVFLERHIERARRERAHPLGFVSGSLHRAAPISRRGHLASGDSDWGVGRSATHGYRVTRFRVGLPLRGFQPRLG